MTEKEKTKISKRLSLVLRHQPDAIGIRLDEQGWVSVNELLQKFSHKFSPLSMEQLEEVVATNNKKRYAFNEDKSQIRASQGHSVEVALGYEPTEPPAFLYHGTTVGNLDSIRKTGIQKRSRHHVHLSPDKETAINVGSRHGKPVILTVKSEEMHQAGKQFFCSANGVWLTESIEPEYIIFE